MVWCYAALTVVLGASLARLHRVQEVHHGYMGIGLGLLSLVLWPWLQWVGLVLLADDTYQHAFEAYCVIKGWTEPGDFTLIHRFGSWLLERLGGK